MDCSVDYDRLGCRQMTTECRSEQGKADGVILEASCLYADSAKLAVSIARSILAAGHLAPYLILVVST